MSGDMAKYPGSKFHGSKLQVRGKEKTKSKQIKSGKFRPQIFADFADEGEAEAEAPVKTGIQTGDSPARPSVPTASAGYCHCEERSDEAISSS
jgi:hypothetical protein